MSSKNIQYWIYLSYWALMGSSMARNLGEGLLRGKAWLSSRAEQYDGCFNAARQTPMTMFCPWNECFSYPGYSFFSSRGTFLERRLFIFLSVLRYPSPLFYFPVVADLHARSIRDFYLPFSCITITPHIPFVPFLRFLVQVSCIIITWHSYIHGVGFYIIWASFFLFTYRLLWSYTFSLLAYLSFSYRNDSFMHLDLPCLLWPIVVCKSSLLYSVYTYIHTYMCSNDVAAYEMGNGTMVGTLCGEVEAARSGETGRSNCCTTYSLWATSWVVAKEISERVCFVGEVERATLRMLCQNAAAVSVPLQYNSICFLTFLFFRDSG